MRSAKYQQYQPCTCHCQQRVLLVHNGHDAAHLGPDNNKKHSARFRFTSKTSHRSLTHEHVSAVEASIRRRGNTSLLKENDKPQLWDLDCLQRIGPVLEVTTSFKNFKHGIEIRIWSVGQDNSQSRVRISYGTNKYVIDSNHNNTEIPADPHEDQKSQTSVKVIAARSKAKAKPQKSEPVDTPSIILMHERKWIDIEPSAPSLTAYEVSKKVISLLRHNQTVQREDDGAIQFGESIFINSHKYSIGLLSV